MEESHLARWARRLTPRAIFVLAGLSTVLRILYALLVMDPRSGPDTPTYLEWAYRFAEDGLFAPTSVFGHGTHSLGYPALLSIAVRFFGSSWLEIAMILQVLIVTVAVLLVWQMTRVMAGSGTANITAIALLILPSLTAASTQLMYEALMGSLVVIAVWIVYFVMWPSEERKVPNSALTLMLAGAGILLGICVVMQSRVLAFALLVPVFVVLSRRSPKRYRAQAALSYGLGLCVILIPVLAHNHSVTGKWGFSYNLAVNVGLANEGRQVACSIGGIQSDIAQTLCYFQNDLTNPAVAAERIADQFFAYFAPLIYGPWPGSTWFHGFSIFRFLDSYKDGTIPPLASMWAVWTIAIVPALFLLGAVVLFTRSRWLTLFLVSAPVLMATTAILVRGDNRYRIPGILLATPFVVYGLLFSLAAIGALWLNHQDKKLGATL